MSFPKELSQLVIRNMEIIEIAPTVVDAIEKRLFSAINKRIKDRVSGMGWNGFYGLVTGVTGKSNDTSFAPESWPRQEDESLCARYSLTYTRGDGDDLKMWLSSATGILGDSLCFAFSFDRVWGEMKRPQYKATLENFYHENAVLRQSRFSLAQDKESIIIPFLFDSEKLADEYPDFDDVLVPLDDALEALFGVHDEFDAFVKTLTQK